MKIALFPSVMVALVGMILLAAPAQACCKYTLVSYSEKNTVETHDEASFGAICRRFFSPPGNGMLIGIEIIEKPRFGQFGAANRMTMAYKAPNTVGKDSYLVRINYEWAGRTTWTQMRVNISIFEK